MAAASIELVANRLIKQPEEFRYRFLARLEQDCKYYLGYGRRHTRYLWAKDVEDQLYLMGAMYDSFPEDGKPDWFNKRELNRYAELMRAS